MSIIKNIFGIFTNIRQVWNLVKLIREWNAIRASYPGVADENQLRNWLLANANRLVVFSKTTTNTIDDAIALYVRELLSCNTTWAIIYNTLRMICGIRVTNDAVYGASEDIPSMFDRQDVENLKSRTGELLTGSGVKLTHEQLTAIATGVIVATIAQLQEK